MGRINRGTTQVPVSKQTLILSVTRINVPDYKRHTKTPSPGILGCEISNQLFLWSSQPVTPILFKAVADLVGDRPHTVFVSVIYIS